jgi:hypothetical protein
MFSWKGPEFSLEVKAGFSGRIRGVANTLDGNADVPAPVGPLVQLLRSAASAVVPIAPGSMRQYQNVLPEMASWVWMTKCSVRTEAIAAWKQ